MDVRRGAEIDGVTCEQRDEEYKKDSEQQPWRIDFYTEQGSCQLSQPCSYAKRDVVWGEVCVKENSIKLIVTLMTENHHGRNRYIHITRTYEPWHDAPNLPRTHSLHEEKKGTVVVVVVAVDEGSECECG